MKRKILTMMLCCTMAFSLAACGGKQEKHVNTEVNGQSDEKEEEKIKSAEEDPTPEPEAEEPEQVELTADTIDKYFGFEYADTADDAVTGFTLEVNQAYGTETLSVAHVPMVYSDSECPTIDELAGRFNEYAQPGVDPVGLYFNPFTELLSQATSYSWAADIYGCLWHVNMDGTRAGSFDGHVEETPEWQWATTNGLTPVYLDPLMYGDKGQKVYSLYAMMQPESVMNAFNKDDLHAGLLIANHSSDFARVEDSEITGLVIPFTSDKVSVTVAGLITSESTIKDVVTKYAPSAGTIADNGAIVLTWNTTSGSSVEITFSANDYKPISVSILASNMTPEILEGLGLQESTSATRDVTALGSGYYVAFVAVFRLVLNTKNRQAGFNSVCRFC